MILSGFSLADFDNQRIVFNFHNIGLEIDSAFDQEIEVGGSSIRKLTKS